MGVITKIKKLNKASLGFNLMIFEAFFLSLFYEIMLRLNIYQPIKDLHQNTTEELPESPEKIKTMTQVSSVIKLMQKYAPWKPMCYNRAMTAKRMLMRRNIFTNMNIGFRKKNNEFDGHAWLTYNRILVTGKVKDLSSFKKLQPTGEPQ